MPCNLTITLLSEKHSGDYIGNDWKYTLIAETFGPPKFDEGRIEVPKHRLDKHVEQAPPGPPEALVLGAGEPGTPVTVDLRLQATEVDLINSDHGEMVTSFKLECPAAGAPTLSEEREITVGVLEENTIGFGDKNAVLALKLRLELGA